MFVVNDSVLDAFVGAFLRCICVDGRIRFDVVSVDCVSIGVCVDADADSVNFCLASSCVDVNDADAVTAAVDVVVVVVVVTAELIVIVVLAVSTVSFSANGASVRVTELAVADSIDWVIACRLTSTGVDATVAEIVGIVDSPTSNSAEVLPAEAKTVGNGTAGIIVVIVVFVVIDAAAAGDNAAVFVGIWNDVALAFAISKTAFVSA